MDRLGNCIDGEDLLRILMHTTDDQLHGVSASSLWIGSSTDFGDGTLYNTVDGENLIRHSG